jgi:hypothetical protein
MVALMCEVAGCDCLGGISEAVLESRLPVRMG